MAGQSTDPELVPSQCGFYPTQQGLQTEKPVPREEKSREKHLRGVLVFLKLPQCLEGPLTEGGPDFNLTSKEHEVP